LPQLAQMAADGGYARPKLAKKLDFEIKAWYLDLQF
jgi:hypothetical protein